LKIPTHNTHDNGLKRKKEESAPDEPGRRSVSKLNV
jgi:hypothetical protein